MTKWLGLVTKCDQQIFKEIYGDYLDALPESIKIVSIETRPGLCEMKQAYIDLCNYSGTKARLILSTDHSARIHCHWSLNDKQYREMKSIETCFDGVKAEDLLLEERVCSFFAPSNENRVHQIKILSDNPWLHHILRKLPVGIVGDINQPSVVEENGIQICMDFKDESAQAQFDFIKGSLIYRRKVRLYGKKRDFDRTNKFVKNLVEGVKAGLKETKNYLKLFERHDLSLQSQRSIVDNEWLYPLGIVLFNRQMRMVDVRQGMDLIGDPCCDVTVSLLSDHPLYDADYNRAIFTCRKQAQGSNVRIIEREMQGPDHIKSVVKSGLKNMML